MEVIVPEEVFAVGLRDVTAEGVERAMAEFDHLGRENFLEQYGFGQARSYFVTHRGQRYDSKAVAGVAHGYDRPDLGPLRAQDFSGGDATVARHLRSLGFDVEERASDPTWAEEELVLALDLYLRSGLLGAAHPDVLRLSDILKDLTIHSERRDSVRFRNANSVKLKLANFAAIDPNHDGQGMKHVDPRDVEVWARFASDEDALAEAAAAIREGREPPTALLAEPTRPQVVPVEEQHVEEFRVSNPGQDKTATRREQSLVRKYTNHLRDRDHEVTRHRYPLGSGSALVCDLVDETDQVLYEAKGDVKRTSVRMAIGQLLDYRRFEKPPKSLAILLPREPAADLIALIHSVPAFVVWPTKGGFESSQPPALQD